MISRWIVMTLRKLPNPFPTIPDQKETIEGEPPSRNKIIPLFSPLATHKGTDNINNSFILTTQSIRIENPQTWGVGGGGGGGKDYNAWNPNKFANSRVAKTELTNWEFIARFSWGDTDWLSVPSECTWTSFKRQLLSIPENMRRRRRRRRPWDRFRGNLNSQSQRLLSHHEESMSSKGLSFLSLTMGG